MSAADRPWRATLEAEDALRRAQDDSAEALQLDPEREWHREQRIERRKTSRLTWAIVAIWLAAIAFGLHALGRMINDRPHLRADQEQHHG